ncbi:2,4-dihydroxyhept-2-ene-1,7-dioic acid aldolase [Micrococcales bacterium 31B]|nr:2,4-dihydroxyhept-2-ene-1,7-dioic acid aldolase [Micrococcales bacterium 31B]
MRTHHLRQHLEAGRTAVNAWLSLGSPYAAEIIAHCGFDSVTLDLQHGMFSRDAVVAMLQAVSTSPATPLVRPTRPDPDEIGWLLDAGAYGIIVPSVHDAATARRVVDACFYPPHGTRSFGPSRGITYGGTDYVAASRETLTPWVMIESRAALDALDEICAVPGLFGVYVGPNDLALDLGHPAGGLISDEVSAITYRINQVAHRHGVRTGIFCANADEAAHYAEVGFDLVTPGNDASLLRHAASQRIEAVRAVEWAASEAPLAVKPESTSGGY